MSSSILTPDQFKLQRYPKTSDKSLRAWSAADELIIEQLNNEFTQAPPDADHQTEFHDAPKTLIINDQFGALSVCLNHWSPFYWTDSYLSGKAITTNLNNNYLNKVLAAPFPFTLQTDLHFQCDSSITKIPVFDLVIIRVPKHNSLLTLQLEQIKPLINSKTRIIAAGMTKEIHNNNLKIFQRILGTTTTSLAKKKARLIYSDYDNQAIEQKQHCVAKVTSYEIAQEKLSIVGLPGVFARDNLDIGARVMMDYLPELQSGQKVIDLGCGNGVLGAVLARRFPKANILLTDESELAVESAKLTFEANELNNGHFLQTDALDGVIENDFSHIVCNPPFHQQNVQTIDIAQKMFKQAAEKLSPEGELRVVANRHLKYAPILKRLFQKVQPLSADKKFTVWLANYPRR